MVLRRAILPPMEVQNEHMVDKKEDGPESTLMPKHHRFFKWQFQLATPNRPVSKLGCTTEFRPFIYFTLNNDVIYNFSLIGNFRNRHLAEMD